MRKAEDKKKNPNIIYTKDRTTMNYDIAILVMGIGIIIMLGYMLFIK